MIFGDPNEQENFALLHAEENANGRRTAQFKYGDLTIRASANKPSAGAIKRAGKILNSIAIEHVELHQQVGAVQIA